METNTIHTGDVFDVLPELPESSVHMVMTSPPYWNLRDYGEEEQLGLEDTPEQFVKNLAAVFDEVKRVLRPDGSLWLNLGDTYDDKDLQQIPARVALALQDRGWILRNRVTWAKPNPMPQSVKDRLNDTTEAIFHFTLSRDYFYDLDAIREPHAESTRDRMGNGYRNTADGTDKRNREDAPGQNNQSGGMNSPGVGFDEALHEAGKNPGDVFEVTTKPFSDAHFAVYPPELCGKPLKATCPPKVCAGCGTPYEREIDETVKELPESGKVWDETSGQYRTVEAIKRSVENNTAGGTKRNGYPGRSIGTEREFTGWRQTCDCDTDATQAGTALDPFAGAGTTLLKAKELGRKFVGVELNPEYADMARSRVGLSPDDPSHVRGDDAQRGFEAFE